MFTGIVQELGLVARTERAKGLLRLTVDAPKTASKVQRMESVTVNGVCLTVVNLRRGMLIFEVIQETQELTTLDGLRQGDRVNLEPSLSVTERFNGHLVLGHVDGMGRVVRRRQRAGELVLEIRVQPRLCAFLVSKGPVAIDGVSLTVGRLLGTSTFSVHLIPETLRHTTLGERVVSAAVNVELDYFAKLIRQFLTDTSTRQPRPERIL